VLRAIIGWSLRFRLLIIGLTAATLIAGYVLLPTAPIDALPEFSPPRVEIQTEALGLSAEEVEQLITVPIEADLLAGVAWLESIQSQSVTGLSSIVLTFEPGTDPIRARQMVSERMTQAHALPNVSKAPAMLQPLSSENRLMMVGLQSDEHSLIELSVLARWTIRPRLMGVPGVANVAIWGQREQQLQVQVDPERLAETGLEIDDVIETTGNALWVSPLTYLEASTPGTGGFIDTPNQRFGIQHIFPITTPEDLEGVPVTANDNRYRLSDVATVVEDHQPLIGDAFLNSTGGIAPGLILVIEKFPEANTLDVTRDVEAALAALQPGLGGVQVDTSVFRPAGFIESAVDGLTVAVLIALLLLLIVVMGLLFDWRAALVSLIAVPVSLTAAALVLVAYGASINAMLVAGFVAAMGVVVDDAIATSTAVMRRASRAEDSSASARMTEVVSAILEVRGPAIYALLILGLAIAPLFLLGDVGGALMPSLLLAYVAAIVAATVVGMLVTPALAVLLLPSTLPQRNPSRLLAAAQGAYGRLLARTFERARPAFVAVGVLSVAVVAAFGLLMAPSLASLDAPAFQERDLLVQFDGPVGTSHTEMSRIVASAAAELQSTPGIENVGAHIGRAILSDEVSDISSGEIWFSISQDAGYDATLASVQSIVDGYPGLDRRVVTYPQQRLEAIAGGQASDLTVRVFGQQIEPIRQKAGEVRDVLAGIDGISSATVETQPQEASIQVDIDLEAAARYQLKPGDIRRAAATLLAGVQVGSLFEEQKIFEVVVWGTPEMRQSVTSVAELPLVTPGGQVIRLDQVADVNIAPAPSVILRDEVQRRMDVTATISGRDAGSVVADVEAAIAAMDFPLENHAEVLGYTADREANRLAMIAVAIGAIIGILLLLQAAFSNWRLAAYVLLSLPAALSGGVAVAFATGNPDSIGAVMGLVAVLGIALRQGILLMAHYRQLVSEGSERFGLGLALRGARERMAGSLTSIVGTAAVVLPLVVLGGLPGFEVVAPMGAVILGGLVTSALLSLFVFPTLFLKAGESAATEFAPMPAESTERQAVGAS
jgi:Cu/Ag efflux pump CusA